MGIYVKYMEMPEGCVTCYLKHDCCDFKQQISSGNIIEYIDKRLDTCPLIEVTEPHGRLIDADKLDAYKLPSEKQDFKTWHKHSAEYKYAVPVFNSALDMVKNNAPTVIEAEGE